MRVTVIYGTDSGSTRSIAKKIGKHLPHAEVINVAKASRGDFEDCDLLILGAPTCGYGELSEDWERGLPTLEAANLEQKKVALFGTGDQVNYPDTFVDALGILYDKVVARGAQVVGATPTEGYQFDASAALRDGKFVGLALDQDNQFTMTEGRIASWIDGIK